MLETNFLDPRIVALIVAIALAQFVAMLLFKLSQQSRAADSRRKAQQTGEAGGANGNGDDVSPELLRQMAALGIPAAQRQRLATALSSTVQERIEAKLGAVRQEMSQKYDKLVEEKTREAAVVKQKYQETVQQKEQTESVLRSMAEGLVVVNPKGEVVFLNPAAEKLLGMNQKEKLGKKLSDGVGDEQLISLVRGNGSNKEMEIELSAKQDQTKRIVRSSNAVIEDENGRTVGMVSVLTDVTKQRELDRMKSEFVSGVTHELRTPLVAIQHSLGVMLDQAAGELSDPQKNFLNIAQRNLGRLSGMINDLLDLAKLEAHRMEMRPQPAEIARVVQHACDTLNAWAKSKALKLIQKVPGDLPEIVFDPARVEQVLNNLVGNAIKFTPKDGSVTISAAIRADMDALEVTVQDTGSGIAPQDLPKLFRKFQQVGSRQPGDVSGTGLGLAISKEIVELHGGRIWVEGDAGKGARFIFTLPLHPKTPEGGDPHGGADDAHPIS